MASLGRLVVDLLLKSGSFSSDLGRASKETKKRMREIEKAANDAGKVLGTALVAGALAAGVAIKAAIDQADQLNEISKKIGIPTDVLSGLNYAAKLAGVATEELQQGLVKLVKFQADAASGGKASAAVFKALKIDALDPLSGTLKNTGVLFSEFANVFAGLPDGPEKTALALKVFGKAGAELIPLLNEGQSGIAAYTSELERLGGVVTPEAAAQADQFNDNLDKLKVAVGGLALQVAGDLLPDMIALTESFVSNTTAGEGVSTTANTIADGFRLMANSGAAAVDIVQMLTSRALSLYNVLEVMSTLNPGNALLRFFGASDSVAENLRQAQAAGEMAGEEANSAFGRFGKKTGKATTASSALPKASKSLASLGLGGSLGGSKAKAAKKDVDEIGDAYRRMNAQMSETIALFGQTTEVAKVRYDLEHGELAKLDPLRKGELIQLAQKIDFLKQDEEARKQAIKDEEEQAEAIKRHKDDFKALLDDIAFETELTKLSNEEKEKAIALRSLNGEASIEEAAAITASIDALQKARKENGQLIDNLDEFRSSFSDNVTDVLTGAKSIGDAFKSMADLIVAQLARILANKITENLFGSMGSAGGGSQGSFLSTLFSAFLGGGSSSGSFGIPAPGSGPLPGFAHGTMNAPGGWAMVGERGPELVNLPRGSKVFPNGKGPGRGSTVIQNINVSENTSRATAEQLAFKAGRSAQVAMARNS